MSSLHQIQVQDIQGKTVTLESYKGRVLLIVNVASKCGYTPQYTGLEELQKKYFEKGFSVLGFPCNQFGGQEPGENAAIQEFCTLNFGVSFPMFSKVEVNGEHTSALYKHLKKEAPGILGTEAIKWNFTKFLVDREGRVVRRYAPQDTPESIADDIEKLL